MQNDSELSSVVLFHVDLMRMSDEMNVREIDRFSLDCFVRGFVINPFETTADYHLEPWRNRQTQRPNAYTAYIMLQEREAVHEIWEPLQMWFAFQSQDSIIFCFDPIYVGFWFQVNEEIQSSHCVLSTFSKLQSDGSSYKGVRQVGFYLGSFRSPATPTLYLQSFKRNTLHFTISPLLSQMRD